MRTLVLLNAYTQPSSSDPYGSPSLDLHLDDAASLVDDRRSSIGLLLPSVDVDNTEDDDDVPLTNKEKALLATLEADVPATQFEDVSDVEDDHHLVDLTSKVDHEVPDGFRLNTKLIWKLRGAPPSTCPSGRTNCNKGKHYTQKGAMQGHLCTHHITWFKKRAEIHNKSMDFFSVDFATYAWKSRPLPLEKSISEWEVFRHATPGDSQLIGVLRHWDVLDKFLVRA
ncbi:hypothetical protein LTR10_005579 [Elasticomyces elasticus]|nr:hypothetical protein LTR10_005579 [Elasticomyces elasticus]KAK4976316.1 hypothetical protein LTR42_003945 [Elasticomyces elasticus]